MSHRSHRWRRFAFLGLVALTGYWQTAAHKTSKVRPVMFSQDRRLIEIQLKDFPRELRHLLEEGYSLAGVDIPNKVASFYVDTTGSKSLRALKSNVGILSDRPVSFSSPDAAYMTPTKVEAAMKKYVADYPGLTKLESLGKSVEGRDIFAIKISSTPGEHSAQKPVVFFNGMHHAREVMTAEVGIDTIDYLLTNYGHDAKVTRWVDTLEIWVLPMFNVDGNNKVWTVDNLWRKNANQVDINRNYPYRWAGCQGSSVIKQMDDYHGPSAASEPETREMMSFVSRIRPVFSISYHSFSEIVLYPYGCEGEQTPNHGVIENIGAEMAKRLPRDGGNGTYLAGTPWELIYPVDGDDIDWMYQALDVIPFGIELNNRDVGFQPPFATTRDKTVRKARGAWTYLLDRAGGSGIRAVVTDRRGALLSDAAMTVTSADAGARAQSWRVKPDGSVHAVLSPGKYKVTFASPGYDSQEQVVDVGDSRVDLEIGM